MSNKSRHNQEPKRDSLGLRIAKAIGALAVTGVAAYGVITGLKSAEANNTPTSAEITALSRAENGGTVNVQKGEDSFSAPTADPSGDEIQDGVAVSENPIIVKSGGKRYAVLFKPGESPDFKNGDPIIMSAGSVLEEVNVGPEDIIKAHMEKDGHWVDANGKPLPTPGESHIVGS